MENGRSARVRRGRGVGDPELLAAARDAADRAYAPYSGFAVGAALRDADGRITTGFNVENAAHPLGICAERAALLDWRRQPGRPISRIVIHTDTVKPTSPCGLCRDALLRWAPKAAVFLSCRQGQFGPYRAMDWLPAQARERGR